MKPLLLAPVSGILGMALAYNQNAPILSDDVCMTSQMALDGISVVQHT